MADETAGKRIAVIGAGAAGLCAAKYMKAAGFAVTVFEIGTQIGGLWCYLNDNGRSSAYRTLHINTSKGVTHFHDFDFDESVQFFPSHWDMHRYLVQYADRFGVTPLIRFTTPVKDVRPAGPSRWEIETAGGDIETFDAVIVASGHLTKPLHVPSLRDPFTGEYIHSHDYRAPEPFVGKKICVIGVGNSACDIASDVCVTAPRTVLVARSGVVILPKLLFGLPFTDITHKIQRRWLPASLRRRLIHALVWIAHGDMTKLGFKKLTEQAHVTSNATVVTHIAYDRIHVKQGIDRIEGRRIHFVDGTSDEFDTLIAATGYLIDLPFIAPDIVPVMDNRIDLYQRMVHPGRPGLYFMGMFNTDTALNMVYEHQARWITEIELGHAALPPDDEMWASIRARDAQIEAAFKASPRHTIEEPHVPYIAMMARTLRRMRRAARKGSVTAG
jgi:dimethylaniline monooxygenase (N-oxide forming)